MVHGPARVCKEGGGEVLYNGIRLPAPQWPPSRWFDKARGPERIAYLEERPAVAPIDVGRQLFVDDFLIESTDLPRTFHQPAPHPANPILMPETPDELDGGECPMAGPFNDGAWYDPTDGLFKLWYSPGWMNDIALAVSRDGIHWDRPSLDVEPRTNKVIAHRPGWSRDGTTVWLDSFAADATKRFRLFAFWRHDGDGGRTAYSGDGIHWTGWTRTGVVGDNTGFFYNPFRRKWVLSLRPPWPQPARVRYYREADEFDEMWQGKGGMTLWAATDDLDLPEPGVGMPTEMYDVNAVAYESLMIGLFAIFRGPQNPDCERLGCPKIIDLTIGFSRDGFHFDRPDRRPFIASSRVPGAWDRGYVHAAGGICLVVGDRLFFYYGTRSGESPRLGPGMNGRHPHAWRMYAGGYTGLAVLRRDGFASMDAGAGGGVLTTRPVSFSGRRLFINADAAHGEVRAEALGETGAPIPGFTAADCLSFSGDSTAQAVRFSGGRDLSDLAGSPVRFRFHLRNARLFSFWVSAHENGASGGYVAAGGPGFSGPVDAV